MNVTIHHRGETASATEETWQSVADELCRRLGPWDPATSSVTRERSTFERQVTDESARARIETTHDALREAGVNVDASRQLFETGTRMGESGYARQAERAREHAAKLPIKEAAATLVEQIKAERRRDIEVPAGELGKALSVNGALRFDGLKLREQAVRGVLGRIKSPALSYVLGLRERIADPEATDASKALDKAALLDVMQRECARFADVKLKLRTRDGLGDVFAIVSPEYAPADAPDVLGDVLNALPSDARTSFSYDPTSTTWELRASVFTPTPTDMQAVGEPFEGYVAFSSRDNGTRKLTGGGGILLIACLNASTYEADSTTVARRHVGAILTDLAAMSRDASRAIHALCQAWGTARADVIEVPELVPIEEAIPGFFRCMLTSRKGELVGVLPGRTAQHVERLKLAYNDQRRDSANVTRADLAQAFTRHIQDVPAATRRDAERAIGRWVVSREPVSYVAA
jgi:hypothetical protein